MWITQLHTLPCHLKNTTSWPRCGQIKGQTLKSPANHAAPHLTQYLKHASSQIILSGPVKGQHFKFINNIQDTSDWIWEIQSDGVFLLLTDPRAEFIVSGKQCWLLACCLCPPSLDRTDSAETDSTGERQELWPGEERGEDRWPSEGKTRK